MWKNVQGEGVPQSFDTLCHETVSTLVTLRLKIKKKMTNIFNLSIALRILHDDSELSHPAQPSRAGLLCSDGEKCHFGPPEEIGDSIG